MEEKEALNTEETADEAIEEEITEENEAHNRNITWRRMERFLSTFAAISLSIMSIIISVISVNNEKDSKAIAAMELDILNNDREAYFVVENKVWEESEDGGYAVFTIKNEGGRVSGFGINPYARLEIYMTDYKSPEYSAETGKMIDPGYLYERIYVVNLKNIGFTENGKTGGFDYEVYNPETKQFKVKYKFTDNFSKFTERVNAHLKTDEIIKDAAFAEFDLKVSYGNYKNELKQEDYRVTTTSIVIRKENSFEDVEQEEVYFSFTDYGEKDAENLVNYIKTRFEIDRDIYLAGLEKEK